VFYHFHASRFWSTPLFHGTHISHKIHKISRRRSKMFTKSWLPGKRKLTYHQRLSILELDSLELRRVRADLLFKYKHINLHDVFVPHFNEARRGHNYKLYLPACKSNIRSNNFNYRVIRKLNSLASCIDFTSLKTFHKSLAPKVLLPYCKVFLFSCMCCVFTLCFVYDIHVYFKVSLHVFHAYQCKRPVDPCV